MKLIQYIMSNNTTCIIIILFFTVKFTKKKTKTFQTTADSLQIKKVHSI